MKRFRIPAIRQLLALLIIPLFLWHANASAANVWLDAAPTITPSGNSISPSEFDTMRLSKIGDSAGMECIEKRIARRAFGSRSIQFEDTCWYQTSLGLLSERGDYLLRTGDRVAGHIGTTSPSQPLYHPTPLPDVFLELTPALASGSGYYLAFREAKDFLITSEYHLTGTVTHTIGGEPTYTPLNDNGSRFYTGNNTVSWSEDRRYMLAWSNRGILYRFNMEDGYKAIAARLLDYGGTQLHGSAAISLSGQYGAVTVEIPGGFSDFMLVDFTTCSGEQLLVMTDNTCRRSSIKPVMQAAIPGYSFARLPRFFSDNTIGVYHRPAGSTENYAGYYVQAAGTLFEPQGYTALGDSFSSGEGAGEYIDGTDVKNVNMCHTSRNSYPYVINDRLNLTSFFSGACSGARMEHYWQTKQHNRDVSYSFFPGRDIQRKLIDYKIVTITMSGNDIRFTDKLTYCLLWSANCYNTRAERQEIAAEIAALHPELVKLYRDIMNINDVKRRLYVLGYPQLADPSDDAKCAANALFNTYQRSMANDLITYFNAVISSAAREAGAFYAGTEGALIGHRLCEGPSATAAVNGITFGDETGIADSGPLSNGSYHPNQLGHQLLAAAVIEKTDNLKAPMPEPLTTGVPDPANYQFMQVPDDGGIVHHIRYNKVFDNPWLQRAVNLPFKIIDPLNPFKSNSVVQALVFSDPVNLGSYTADALGYVSGELQLPADLSHGMHELRLNGIDADGKPLSVRQFIYVYAELQDNDGNGITDSDEPCRGIISPAGIDTDADGTDDACDPFIAAAPQSVPTAPVEEPTNDSHNAPIAPIAIATSLAVTSSPSSQQRLSVQYTGSPVTGSVLSGSETPGPSPQENTPVLPDKTAIVPTKQVNSPALLYLLAITLLLALGYSTYIYARKQKQTS